MFREGQQIGQYTLIGKLGKGGFGEVWLAEKRSQFIVKRVAVKLPHDEQVNFDAIRQEAQLWEAASGHPNVLPIIDADVYDGQVCIVSEYASGGSLHERLKREGKLPIKEAVETAIGILNGLEFLHSRKIIHRDIKPQNILLQGNTPRLADFGISRAMNTTMISSAIIGTDAYMSPESFDGKRSIQTDIWSVGVVLYQMLKGSLPFPQEHPTERMFAVLTKNFEPLPDEIPANLRRIVEKSLQKLSENRYATTTEMRDELLKAHVPLAHPTLAKTEVFTFKNEPELLDNQPPMQTAPETIVDNPPKIVNQTPIYAPAPTQPAIQQESVVTHLKQTPFVAAKQQNVLPEIQPVGTATKSVKQEFKNILIWVGFTAIGFLLIGLFIIGVVTRKSGNFEVVAFQSAPSGKFGFKDRKGNIVVQPKYTFIGGAFYENMMHVRVDNKYGYIDQTGKEVIPLKYDNAERFNNGLAAVKKDGRWGFIDKNDIPVIPFKYDRVIAYYSGDYVVVELNGRKLQVDRYREKDIGAANNSNPNVSTYNTPAYNKPANAATPMR